MSKSEITIGVLDIQGSVEEHIAMLKKSGVSVIGVKTKEDLAHVSGLIIPGGESTTIGKLMKKYRLDEEIRKRVNREQETVNRKTKPFTVHSSLLPLVVWGTCAGAILLSKKVTNRPPAHLSLMDIEIERNAYGRQVDSFETELEIPELGRQKIPAIFIRAPIVRWASPRVKIMAEYGGSPVMLRQENLLVTMFHPELTDNTQIHRYFISLVTTYATHKT